MQLKTKKKKAFTLVELVIVIAVIGILSAVLVPTFGDVVQSAYLAQDKALVGNINTALAVDEITTGSPNDAIEIQKRLKDDYGLTLETKSAGNYLFYDNTNKKVVLGKLYEGTDGEPNGFYLLENAPAESAIVANADNANGKYLSGILAPELFIEGYTFITTESKDGLAQAITNIRNGINLQANVNDAKEINATVGNLLQDLVNKSVFITAAGTQAEGSAANASVTRIIISGECTTLTADSFTGYDEMTGLIVVDIPSCVENADAATEVIGAMIEKGVVVTYASENANVANGMINIADRSSKISKVTFKEVIKKTSGDYDSGDAVQFNEEISIATGYIPKQYFVTDITYPAQSADKARDFTNKYYSDEDCSAGRQITWDSVNGYELGETDKLLAKNGELVIYRLWEQVTPDFKYGDYYYSSKSLGLVVPKVDNNPTTTADLTVVSNAAVLDFDLTIGTDTTLMLPYTVNPASDDDGIESCFLKAGKGNDNVSSINASVKLTVNKPMTLESGATLEIGAQIATTQPTTSYISDSYAELELNAALESKGNINAYGLITGSGTINATAGTIVNRMRINDYGGGVNTADRIMGFDLKNKAFTEPQVFPFEDWEMDSIRVTTNVKGATYSGWGYMYANGTRLFTDVPLFSQTKNSVFTYGGSATVKYDSGKLTVETEGSITDNAIKVKIENGKKVFGEYESYLDLAANALQLVGIDMFAKYFDDDDLVISLADYYFPLHNMDMTITSGSISLSACKYRIMESSTLTIAAGATATVNNYVIVEGNMIVNGNLTTVGVAVQETESCKHTIVTHDYTHDSKDTFISYLSGKIESTENGEIKVDVTLKNWSKSCSGALSYNVTVTYGDAVAGPYSCTNVDYYHLEPAGGTNYVEQERNQTSASLQLLGTVGSVSGSFMPNVTYTYSNGEWTYSQAT